MVLASRLSKLDHLENFLNKNKMTDLKKYEKVEVLNKALKIIEKPNSRIIGLCEIAWMLDSRSRYILKGLLVEERKNHKKFYRYNGTETSDPCQFIWPAKRIKVRINWLKSEIKKYKDD
jgi:hypothetical protein